MKKERKKEGRAQTFELLGGVLLELGVRLNDRLLCQLRDLPRLRLLESARGCDRDRDLLFERLPL